MTYGKKLINKKKMVGENKEQMLAREPNIFFFVGVS
jgi:hypothetical protein